MIKKKMWEIIDFFLDKLDKRKKIKYWESLISNPNVKIDASFMPFFQNNIFLLDKSSKIFIKKGVNTRKHCNFLVWNNAELAISENVFFNNYCSINCLERIEIGENTFFDEAVKLYDHNHLIPKNELLTISKDKFTTAPITIGKNCWIASNVTILKGVTIGEGAIVAAGSVVTKTIAPYTLVAGNPARFIKNVE